MSWKGGNSWGNSWGNGGSWQNKPNQYGKGAAAASAKVVAASGGIKPGSTINPRTSVVGPSAAQQAEKKNAAKAKLTKFTSEVNSLENTMKPAIETANKALENEKATAAHIKAAMDNLETKQKKANDTKTEIIKETAEVRKIGPLAADIANDMQKLLIKLSGFGQQVLVAINKLKPRHTKAQSEAANKAKEVKDAAAFKTVLAKATADVTAATNAVNAVTKQVDPLVLKPPDEGEEREKKLEAVEKSAGEAAKKCDDARKAINEKMKEIQAYAPETKKDAQTKMSDLQKKLSELTRKCNTYKAFKREFPKLVENQKAVVEITEKLAGHESAITKASKAADGKNLTADQVKKIDEDLEPVQKAVKEANSAINSKSRGCDAATQEKFNKLKARVEEITKKVNDVISKIKTQRDALKAEEAVETAKEKFKAVEEGWKACQEAEMPFLTGLEVLPGDINETALKESAEAIKTASSALGACRSWVQSHLNDCKSYEKELSKSTSDSLNSIMKEMKEIDSKVNQFRRETGERKTTSAVAEVVGPFEDSVSAAEEAGKTLSSKELEDEKPEAISAAVEKAKEALAKANEASAEAHKLARSKGGGNAGPKIHAGLKDGQDKLHQLKNRISSAEKLVKAKAAIPTGEEAMSAAEKSVAAAQAKVPGGDAGLSMEQITDLDEACKEANKAIQSAGNVFNAFVNNSPPKTKEALQKLAERKKAAHDAIHKIKADTKERKEETLATHFLEEAEAKTKAAESLAAKLDEAEGPFLVGASHDLKKTREILAQCEEAAKGVDDAIKAARQDSNEKSGKARSFGEASAKKVKEGLAGMAERTGKANTKLITFKKETASRTKESRVVEAHEKVDEAEASVKKAIAAVEPFEKEGAAEMSEADAAAPLKVFMDLDKETRKLVGGARSFIGACQGEQGGNKDQLEALKKLSERIATSTKDLQEKKKVTEVHEKKALGTRLLAECKEEISGLDAEVKKAKDACEALVEKGGEQFITAACVRVFVNALKDYMSEKETDVDALFKDAGGKKMNDKAFVKYVSSLPEKIDHDELSAFSEERLGEMFKALSTDGKSITQEGFKGMFAQKMRCRKPVAVTNQFEVEGAETICKLELDAVVELTGSPKEDGSGMVRSECKVDGKTGWVTTHQKKGERFLSGQSSAYAQYCNDAEKALRDFDQAVYKARGNLHSKMTQGGKAEDGSRLKEARDEMAKLKEPLGKIDKECKEAKDAFHKAKGGYQAKEREVLNAHIVARNAKEAAPFVDGPKAKLAAAEAAANAVQEAGAAMAKLTGEELEAFATPATVVETVEKHSTEFAEKAGEVREAVKEQQKAVNEVKEQTGGTAEAKKQLSSISQQLSTLQNKTRQMLPQLKGKCSSLVKSKLDPASEGIRKHCANKKKTPDELFASLAKDDKIPDEAFCKLLQSLEGLNINAEHAKLITRKVSADGIDKEAFTKYVVIYFKVAKTIAFTDGLDISKCKTLRKGVDNEIVECLEGPITVTYEGSQMTRIRGRATDKEGKLTEGWLTVSGSKGTPFLEKCNAPAPKLAEKK